VDHFQIPFLFLNLNESSRQDARLQFKFKKAQLKLIEIQRVFLFLSKTKIIKNQFGYINKAEIK